MMKYFSKNANFNSFVHFVGGVGVGIILSRPVALDHPVRLGVVLIVASLLGHLYASTR